MTADWQDGELPGRRDGKPARERGGRRQPGPPNAPAEIVLTPAQFLAAMVLPTLAEFLDDLANPRRAYLACMMAAHLVDQVTRSERVDKPTVRAAVAALGGYKGDALEIVEGISNGTKHAGTGRGEPFSFAPGHEKQRFALEFDVEGRGLDEADWDIPGLTVSHRGATYFINDCVKATVWGFVEAYPNRFVGVDHASVTKPGLDRWGVPIDAEPA